MNKDIKQIIQGLINGDIPSEVRFEPINRLVVTGRNNWKEEAYAAELFLKPPNDVTGEEIFAKAKEIGVVKELDIIALKTIRDALQNNSLPELRYYSVNLSIDLIRDKENLINELLKFTNLATGISKIIFELPEDMNWAEDLNHIKEVAQQVRGLQFALDDIYGPDSKSSRPHQITLGEYLKWLKIDWKFFHSCRENPSLIPVLQDSLRMCKGKPYKIVVEGIESKLDRTWLAEQINQLDLPPEVYIQEFDVSENIIEEPIKAGDTSIIPDVSKTPSSSFSGYNNAVDINSSSTTQGMPTRPSIPAAIAREILIESGHRCAACGSGCPLAQAHIIPWHQSKQQQAADLICLCEKCYQQAYTENWDDEVFREHKQRPWVMRQNEKVVPLPENTTKLELTIKMELEHFDEKEQRWIQYAIAAFLNISPNAILIRSIEKSSVKLTIELPSQSAEMLLDAFERNDPELAKYLYPLIGLKAARCERTRIILRNGNISDDEKSILNDLFTNFTEIMVSSFPGGRSGAKLFLVEPINLKGIQEAPFITKIGDIWEIKEEYEGGKIAEKMLQNLCARIEGDICEYNDYAGIKYTIAGYSLDMETLKTFQEFYRENNEKQVLEVLDRLFFIAGKGWYGRSDRRREFPNKEFYSELLPANYSIKEAEASKDTKLTSSIPDTKIGDFISFKNCKVLHIRRNKLKIKWGDFGYIIDYYFNNFPKTVFKGDNIDITGIVINTRNEILKNNINNILASLTPNGKEKLNTLHNIHNPLDGLAEILKAKYQTISIVHGDLNVNNIIIDANDNPALIDFARTRDNGHTAFDFVELEVDIKRNILSELMDINDLLSIEKALSCIRWGRSIRNIDINKLLNKEGVKAFKVIANIRKLAANYVKEEEYLYGLYLYSLATLKFEDASENSKKFAYISASSAYMRIEKDIAKKAFSTSAFLKKHIIIAGIISSLIAAPFIYIGSEFFYGRPKIVITHINKEPVKELLKNVNSCPIYPGRNDLSGVVSKSDFHIYIIIYDISKNQFVVKGRVADGLYSWKASLIGADAEDGWEGEFALERDKEVGERFAVYAILTSQSHKKGTILYNFPSFKAKSKGIIVTLKPKTIGTSAQKLSDSHEIPVQLRTPSSRLYADIYLGAGNLEIPSTTSVTVIAYLQYDGFESRIRKAEIDWNEGKGWELIGIHNQGELYQVQHTFNNPGPKEVKYRITDESGNYAEEIDHIVIINN